MSRDERLQELIAFAFENSPAFKDRMDAVAWCQPIFSVKPIS